jgi:colanic acid biosynthesis glycosyl transferase WcaI
MKRLWIISEVYFPDDVGTAYYLTGLAEHLAGTYDVRVLCGRPKYNARGASVPRRERRNGVSIERCLDSSLDKNVLALRIFNVFVSSFSIWFKALARIRRGDVVLVVTSPPLLPFGITAAGKLRGAAVVLKIDDVYPEVFVATGLMRKGSLLESSLAGLTKLLYRAADRIFVLGRDMAGLAAGKAGARAARIRIIPNWADADTVAPRPKADNRLLAELGIARKFVVQCAGNMGRAQAVEALLAAADRLRADEPG